MRLLVAGSLRKHPNKNAENLCRSLVRELGVTELVIYNHGGPHARGRKRRTCAWEVARQEAVKLKIPIAYFNRRPSLWGPVHPPALMWRRLLTECKPDLAVFFDKRRPEKEIAVEMCKQFGVKCVRPFWVRDPGFSKRHLEWRPL